MPEEVTEVENIVDQTAGTAKFLSADFVAPVITP